MSQQENENKRKELSSENLNTPEDGNKMKENSKKESEENMKEESVGAQKQETKESTSDNIQASSTTTADSNSTDHEDAMLDESASGKATSDQKAREKENPEEDPYTGIEEKEEAENPFFKEPEIVKETEEVGEEEEKKEKKISDSTDHEDAMVSESASKNKKTENDDDDEDELDSDIGDAVVGENKKSSGNDHEEDMESAVAEDSEDESAGERHDIEKKDYHSMTKEALADELERLLKNEKIQAIKEHVAEIRAEFNAKFDEDLEEKKEDFLADGGNIIDFHYSTPLKKRFNSLYFDYKEQRNNYYKRLKKDLNENLHKRLELIEELKGLLDVEENINTTYNHFKEIQDKWRTAGPIPRDKYNNVWNTYHHHVENFYDFLHLNREFRDMDFKHNLEQKLKVIDRAEELVQEENINRAFRELQMLHKMWKEELGPVAKEYREDIWERFSTATKKIHDKRQEYFNQLDQQNEKNWERKQEIIEKIKEIADQDFDSHNKWQQKIKEIEALTGRILQCRESSPQ